MGDGVVTRYVQLEIRTLQPVKMGSTGSQSDYESALDYVAGSTLRGAIIAEYLKQNSGRELHEDPVERKRWLEGSLRFLNAYPTDESGRRSYPFPACLYADKADMKLFREKGRLDGPVNILEDKKRAAGKVRIKGDFLVEDRDGRWRWLETETQGNLHINLQGERTGLYRYESIALGQKFVTAVAMDDEDEQLLNFFRSFAGRKLYLGGSRSNGYGLCEIMEVREVSRNPEQPAENVEWGQHLYVYCLSDVILRDQCGQLLSVVPESLLEQQIGVKVTRECVAVQTITTSGFNQRWGARLPRLQAIRKGSVLKYRLHGRPDPERLQRLQDRGIGERLSDGYGRVLLLPRLDIRQLVLAEQRERIEADEADKVPNVPSDVAQGMVNSMYRRIMLQRIREQQEYYLLSLSQATNDRSISNSLLATWMNMLGHALNLPSEQGKRGIQEFVESLRIRKKKEVSDEEVQRERLNQKALNSLQYSKIGNERWLDFMAKAIEEADDLDALSRRLDLKWLAVAGVDRQSVFGREETYRLTLSMLREFIRLRRLTRSSRGKGERRA